VTTNIVNLAAYQEKVKRFAHSSEAGEDYRLRALRDEYGLAGYAAYFLILEKISSHLKERGKTASLTLPLKEWADHLEAGVSWVGDLIVFGRDVGAWTSDLELEPEWERFEIVDVPVTIGIPELRHLIEEAKSIE
jgi:hypothetical protein